MEKRKTCFLISSFAALLLLLGFVQHPAHSFSFDANGFNLDLHGYLHQRMSMNMENPEDTPQDDRYDISMMRSTIYVEANYWFDCLQWISFTTIGRYDYEYMTEYMRRLDRMNSADLEEIYNHGEIREGYADIFIGDRLTLRLGKQQVAWGKTDFFKAMDIVHGNDFTWRSFLEADAELVRKPLVMANATILVPELNGSLQIIVRPGLDKDEDIGNTYSLQGGRWANQPNKLANFLGPQALGGFGVPYNWDHPRGDTDDTHFGFRWSGSVGQVEYAIAYLHTLNLDPVVNTVFNPYGAVPRNGFAEFVYTEIDLVGGDFNYYIAPLDIVVRGEIAYTMEQPFNIGTNFFGGALPGFGGIKEKDTIRMMLNFDRQVKWFAKLVRSYRPAFLSCQIFDTWILNHKRSDDLVATAGYGLGTKEHSILFTAILGWNYNLDRVSPGIVFGYDATNDGGMLIPNIKFIKGDHWRLYIEYAMFWDDADKSLGEIEDNTSLFGYFANNDQLYVRLTYQF